MARAIWSTIICHSTNRNPLEFQIVLVQTGIPTCTWINSSFRHLDVSWCNVKLRANWNPFFHMYVHTHTASCFNMVCYRLFLYQAFFVVNTSWIFVVADCKAILVHLNICMCKYTIVWLKTYFYTIKRVCHYRASFPRFRYHSVCARVCVECVHRCSVCGKCACPWVCASVECLCEACYVWVGYVYVVFLGEVCACLCGGVCICVECVFGKCAHLCGLCASVECVNC